MNRNKKDISKILALMNKPEDITKIFNEILTPNEIRDINLRFELLFLLKAKIPQRTIAKELGISLCKITRGSKLLKNKKSIIRKIIFDEYWHSSN